MHSTKALGIIAIILVIGLLAAVGIIGYTVYVSSKTQQLLYEDKQSPQPKPEELELLVPEQFQTIEDADFLTDDGFRIYATHYKILGPGKKGRLIFLHALGRSRSDWKEVAKYLQDRGFESLAIDLRGHGESIVQGEKIKKYEEFPDSEYKNMINDIWIAKQYMLEDDQNETRFGIIGASIGANLALMSAAQDIDIGAVVALSPGLNYHSLEPASSLYKISPRPTLFVASANDKYSYQSTTQLASAYQGYKESKYYDTAGHGTSMFKEKDLLPLIEKFLKKAL